MKPHEKPAASGVTVRLAARTRDRVRKLARSEYRSVAAYIEHLVERDLRERDEAERLVRVHVAAGLPVVPAGDVARETGETKGRHARRAAVLNALLGTR